MARSQVWIFLLSDKQFITRSYQKIFLSNPYFTLDSSQWPGPSSQQYSDN